MLLSPQFPELFRRETYAVNLALVEGRQVENVLADQVLASRSLEGVWDKEYSVVPMGELGGRQEGEKIPQKNITMGYTTYGAVAVEATGKVGLSGLLKRKARDFRAAGGDVDEPKFAGHIADTASRAFLLRRAQRWAKLTAKIFNFGGVQAGDSFFNHRDRTNLSDLPDSDLIYDGCPLFALPSAPHVSFAAGGTSGNGSSPVGSFADYDGTIADTGGYFNAFVYPPSYWALKRVWLHFVNNMQFDENDEKEEAYPDTLLVSTHNWPLWTEILKSHFVEPTSTNTTTNVENVFMMEGFSMKMVPCRHLVKNTWFIGQAKSQGILLLKPQNTDDPWAYWRDENDRSYWISFEDEWGFMIRNWRRWCAGAISTDGTTAPTFSGAAESTWKDVPAGI